MAKRWWQHLIGAPAPPAPATPSAPVWSGSNSGATSRCAPGRILHLCGHWPAPCFTVSQQCIVSAFEGSVGAFCLAQATHKRPTMIESWPKMRKCGKKKSSWWGSMVCQDWPPKPTCWISLDQTLWNLARPFLTLLYLAASIG